MAPPPQPTTPNPQSPIPMRKNIISKKLNLKFKKKLFEFILNKKL
jgi:hypothetical protein